MAADVKIHTGFLFGVTCDQLSPEQTNHINTIAREFSLAMAQKYANGQVEHGGNLWEQPEGVLVAMALDEAIDQVVYLLTLQRVMGERAREREASAGG